MIDFATVDAMLQGSVGRVFPAAQLIAVDHFSLVFERAVGDCSPETLFDIASLTKPISLMALDYPLARERVIRRHPFFRSTYFERRMLFARPVQASLRAAA